MKEEEIEAFSKNVKTLKSKVVSLIENDSVGINSNPFD